MTSTDIDTQIDEQKTLFQKELTSKAIEIEKSRVSINTHQSWYEQNLVHTVYNSVLEGRSVNRGSTESSITINESDLNPDAGDRFAKNLNKIMEGRPSGILKAFAWATGKLAANKQAFLETLKTEGQALVDKAQEELVGSQEKLSQLKDNKWTQIELASEYYNGLVNAITAQNIEAVLEVIADNDATRIAPSIKSDLFSRSINQYDNTLLAIADIELNDPKKESEIVATILNSFGDDFTALQIIQRNIPKIADESIRDRYQAYTNAFAGLMIPIGNTIMNINHIRYATPSKSGLYLYDARGYSNDTEMDADTADAIMAQLSERPNFIRAGDKVMNINHLRYAAPSDSGLYLYDARGYSNDTEMDADTADAIMAQLSERPNFIRAGDKVMNVNLIRYAAPSNSGLYLCDTYGNSNNTEMDADTADAIMAQLSERPNFIRAGDKVMNVNLIRYAAPSNSGLYLCDTYGNSNNTKMDANAADAIMAQLSERPNFIHAGDKVMNVNHLRYAAPSNSGLYLYDTYGNSNDTKMDADTTQAVLKDIRQTGQRLAVIQSYAGQKNELMYGLEAARSWENDYRSSHSNTDSLMDYLPIIIVGAAILFDDDHSHAAGVTPMLLDAGLDNDFSDASIMDGMESSMSDMGIDAFQTDFDTTMQDFGADFDAGGFDTSSSFDTSSVFDSGSMSSGFDGGGSFGL